MELTEKILRDSGFEYIGYNAWRDKSHQIIIVFGNSNKAGCNWYVHVDNDAFESIGTLDFQTIEQLQTFLGLLDMKLDLKIEQNG